MTHDAAVTHTTLKESSSKTIPGPDLSWWKQLGMVRRDFIGFLSDSAALHGDIFCIRPAPRTRIFVLNSAELASEVLLNQSHNFTKSAQTRFMVGKFLGNGLVLSEGAEHAKQRRMLQPNFGGRDLTNIAKTIVSETEKTLASWHIESSVDIEPEMTQLSMRIILQFLVGSRPSQESLFETDIDSDAFRTLATAIGGRFRSMPLPSWLPTPRNISERRAIMQVDQLVRSLLRESRRHGHEGRSLLATLGRGLDASELSFSQVRDQLVSMLFAGHETVAKTLTWTCYLLARNPNIQRRVHAEVETIAKHRSLEAADLARLRTTTNVVKESMRLYPPVWVFDRSPTREIKLGGLILRPKDTIYISPFLLHRQSRYFPAPLMFDPSRFERTEATHKDNSYIPFGLGHRGCIGQTLAFMESVLAIATTLKSFDIRLVDAREVSPQPSATLAPATPVIVRAKRRMSDKA